MIRVDVIESPDDGGWYWEGWDADPDSEVEEYGSLGVYPSAGEAIAHARETLPSARLEIEVVPA